MITALKGFYCQLRGHVWRRAHVGETAGTMYCRRCAATRSVRRRAKVSA